MFECCKELKIEWKQAKYVLLGDDILIGDTCLAESYRKRINLLGVEISDVKTHVSSTFFEFAKRHFLRSQEITPFPLNATL